ncbi:MAG: hypothetical protein ACOYJD_03345 [Christensenellales bacterium]|jgi:hypothetical protein
MRIWSLLKKNQKIIASSLDEFDSPSLFEIMEQVCPVFDIPHPLIIEKHEREFANFSRTIFKPSDFIETVSFDTFEIEVFKEKKGNSQQ